MDTNLIFGGLMALFGLITLTARFVAPDNPRLFRKLQPMKDRFGDGPGLAIHVVAYTVVPLVAGTTLIVRSLGLV